jgi:hypothetical protein
MRAEYRKLTQIPGSSRDGPNPNIKLLETMLSVEQKQVGKLKEAAKVWQTMKKEYSKPPPVGVTRRQSDISPHGQIPGAATEQSYHQLGQPRME